MIAGREYYFSGFVSSSLIHYPLPIAPSHAIDIPLSSPYIRTLHICIACEEERSVFLFFFTFYGSHSKE